MIHTKTWMSCENIMQSERSQSQTTTHNTTYMKCPEWVNPLRQKVDWRFPGTGQKREWQVTS